MQPNPAWVNSALGKSWEEIEDLVGHELMPKLSGGAGTRKPVPVEYGTGHYGTVMPTNTPGIVCKVTSDATEGAFVAAALSLPEWPPGLIRYQRIASLPGKHRDRPLFILWRQEAHDVGKIISWDPRNRHPEEAEAIALLMNVKDAAHAAREMLKRGASLDAAGAEEQFAYEWAGERIEMLERWAPMPPKKRGVAHEVPASIRGAQRLAVMLRFFHLGCEMLEYNNALTTSIGDALGFYFDRGIMMADVHLQNIGRYDHDNFGTGADGVIGITDPGHAVFLDSRYDGVTIDPIGG